MPAVPWLPDTMHGKARTFSPKCSWWLMPASHLAQVCRAESVLKVQGGKQTSSLHPPPAGGRLQPKPTGTPAQRGDGWTGAEGSRAATLQHRCAQMEQQEMHRQMADGENNILLLPINTRLFQTVAIEQSFK